MVAIGVPSESQDEPRIGLTPETVKKLVKAGASVTLRSGAGLRSHFSDDEYKAAGAKIAKSDEEAVAGADIVLTVRRPSADLVKSDEKGRGADRHARSVLGCRGSRRAVKVGCLAVRHGADAAHQPRAEHGRVVLAIESRRL